jgi:hypothetical protein
MPKKLNHCASNKWKHFTMQGIEKPWDRNGCSHQGEAHPHKRNWTKGRRRVSTMWKGYQEARERNKVLGGTIGEMQKI